MKNARKTKLQMRAYGFWITVQDIIGQRQPNNLLNIQPTSRDHTVKVQQHRIFLRCALMSFHCGNQKIKMKIVEFASRLRWLTAPLRFAVRKIRKYRVEIWICDGLERSSLLPLRVISCTNRLDRCFIKSIAFGDDVHEVNVGSVWLWNVSRQIHKLSQHCSMAFVGTKVEPTKLLGMHKALFIPTWVKTEISIPLTSEVCRRETIKADFRKLRKNGLTYRISKELGQLSQFYYNFYLPHIKKAHGNQALVTSFQEAESLFRTGELLFVCKGDIPQGGVLIWYDVGVPRLMLLGIRNAEECYILEGTLAALYIFSFEYLTQSGFGIVRLGSSRPYLNDGALQFKKKFMHRIADATSDGLYLISLSSSESVRAFLVNNPFIFKMKNVICGAYFTNAEAPLSTSQIKQIEKKYYHSGMSQLFIYYLQSAAIQKLEQMTQNIHPELSGRIEQCLAPIGVETGFRPFGET